jgi:hypothetical protein
LRRADRNVLSLRRALLRPAKHLIAGGELCDARTDGIDAPCEICALPKRKVFREHIFEQTFPNRNLARIYARGNDTYYDLARLWHGLLDINDSELVDSAVRGELYDFRHEVRGLS